MEKYYRPTSNIQLPTLNAEGQKIKKQNVTPDIFGLAELNESTSEFVVCINNESYPASLELHKIYRVVPAKDAVDDEDLRIIDESVEDYLNPASYLAPTKVPAVLKESLLRASWFNFRRHRSKWINFSYIAGRSLRYGDSIFPRIWIPFSPDQVLSEGYRWPGWTNWPEQSPLSIQQFHPRTNISPHIPEPRRRRP